MRTNPRDIWDLMKRTNGHGDELPDSQLAAAEKLMCGMERFEAR